MTTPCSARRRNTFRTPASLASPTRSATCWRVIGCVVLASTRSTGPSRVGVTTRNGWLKSISETHNSTKQNPYLTTGPRHAVAERLLPSTATFGAVGGQTGRLVNHGIRSDILDRRLAG